MKNQSFKVFYDGSVNPARPVMIETTDPIWVKLQGAMTTWMASHMGNDGVGYFSLQEIKTVRDACYMMEELFGKVVNDGPNLSGIAKSRITEDYDIFKVLRTILNTFIIEIEGEGFDA